MSRILGIDPGTHRIGFGILEKNGHEIKVIDFGCIDLKEKDKSKRLAQMYGRVCSIIQDRKPDLMAVEALYFFKNQKTVISVAESRGAIMLAGALGKILIVEPTPLQVKQGICGYGRADKVQMQKMIQKILNLKEIPKPDDAADALAVAFWGISYKNYSN
ncbi:MAG: crossover junction endodeoxyribonuclease RuvC [Patescibacteria group bacterium]|nr:crossover junction endodeoxyribonuclease RuvC [Patescibacteria group bacterium]